MAIEGYEALSILFILIALFVWGPQKLPEMAKAIGEAKREFDKAAKGMTSTPINPVLLTSEIKQDPIITAAKSLGIDTEGKTKQELTKEILERAATK